MKTRTLLLALLLLPVVASAAKVMGSDPKAFALLERAHEARYNLPKDLKQLTAEVVLIEDGKRRSATFSFDYKEGVKLTQKEPDEEFKYAARMIVGSVFQHRQPVEFSKGDGRHDLQLTGNDNLVGQQIALNDKMKSFFRVKGDEITEVDRTIGEDHFVVNVLENIRTPDGKTLPKHLAVTHFNARTGAVTDTEYVTDSYAEVDGVWVPSSRTSIVAKAGKLVSKVWEFRNVQIKR